MKTVAYYRVSTQQQGRSGLGIEAQREAVRRFVTASNGWPPVEEFTEIESGTKDRRPVLAAALAACRAHKATLVVAKLDRLARNARYLRALLDSGVDVVFCDLPEIPAGAVGRFLIGQMAQVAELEAGLISERTKAALRAKVARDGQWNRNAAHHLKPGAGQQAAARAVHERAAQAARDVLPLIQAAQASGATSLRQIAKILNSKGLTTVRGAAWTAIAVKRALDLAD